MKCFKTILPGTLIEVPMFVKNFRIHFLMLLLILASFAGAFFFEQNRTENEVRTYLSSWEEDMARSLLAQKDAAPMEKILTHVLRMGVNLSGVESQVSQTQLQKFLSHENSCVASFPIPVSLYGLPAANLQFCQPLPQLAIKTLLSPILFGVLILGFFLIWYFNRENWKIEIERSKLQSRVEMQEELARVSRQVAHDIRSPLSALQLLVGLQHDSDDEKARLLKNASDRIRLIADDLFSRGKMSLQGSVSVLKLRNDFSSVIRELQIQFPQQKIEFQASEKLTGEIPLRPEVWQRIFQNLLKNALEANQQKNESGMVTCSLSVEHKNLILILADQGPGIPKEILGHLGEEGFSFGKKEGTGLGLSSAKRYLGAVGGELSINSKSSGTEVRITCPVQSQSPIPFQGIA